MGAWYFESSRTLQAIRRSYEREQNFEGAGGLTNDRLSRIESLTLDFFPSTTRKTASKAEDDSVDGFNIGMNSGASAGQTVDHCHIHLIPRRTGDVDDPRGGIRHTMPGKGYYQAA